ncbi:MAG TPA: neutral zinc metallopeptidase [Vicinamibacterales bacterium]
MDWEKGRESGNVVEDEGGGGGGFGGGGGGGMQFGGFHIGLGGLVVIVVVSLLFGKNPLEILSLLSGGGDGTTVQQEAPARSDRPSTENDEPHRFVRSILGSTEDVWTEYFQASNRRYVDPKLVLFNGRVSTACGNASEAMGPFYCPGDQLVYLDLSFFHEMDTKFHATGDFARAYVIAHEVGHHVQNLLGVMQQVNSQRQRGAAMEGANGLSVRLELQADCFAGVWGNRSQAQLNWINEQDVAAALNAASSVGDDTLQKQARGYVVPDSFTHGSAAQRQQWFKAGFASGDIKSCDTFSAR